MILSLEDIYLLKAQGKLESELFGNYEYLLMLFELYPNGTTSNTFVQDPGTCVIVGELTGLGPPTDTQGWGIWEVNKIIERNETNQPGMDYREEYDSLSEWLSRKHPQIYADYKMGR